MDLSARLKEAHLACEDGVSLIKFTISQHVHILKYSIQMFACLVAISPLPRTGQNLIVTFNIIALASCQDVFHNLTALFKSVIRSQQKTATYFWVLGIDCRSTESIDSEGMAVSQEPLERLVCVVFRAEARVLLESQVGEGLSRSSAIKLAGHLDAYV